MNEKYFLCIIPFMAIIDLKGEFLEKQQKGQYKKLTIKPQLLKLMNYVFWENIDADTFSFL